MHDILKNTMGYMNADNTYFNVFSGGIWGGGAHPTNPTGTTATGTGTNTYTGSNIQQGGNIDVDESGTQNMGGSNPGTSANNNMSAPKQPKKTVTVWQGGPKPTGPVGVTTTNQATVQAQATAKPGDNKETRVNTDDPTQPNYVDPKEYNKTHDQHGFELPKTPGNGGETPSPDGPKPVITGSIKTYVWIGVGLLALGGIVLYMRHRGK